MDLKEVDQIPQVTIASNGYRKKDTVLYSFLFITFIVIMVIYVLFTFCAHCYPIHDLSGLVLHFQCSVPFPPMMAPEFPHSREYRALDSRTRTTTSTRFSHRTVSARKPASFWREKRDTVVILVRGFARMSSCQNKSTKR